MCLKMTEAAHSKLYNCIACIKIECLIQYQNRFTLWHLTHFLMQTVCVAFIYLRPFDRVCLQCSLLLTFQHRNKELLQIVVYRGWEGTKRKRWQCDWLGVTYLVRNKCCLLYNFISDKPGQCHGRFSADPVLYRLLVNKTMDVSPKR